MPYMSKIEDTPEEFNATPIILCWSDSDTMVGPARFLYRN